MWDDVSNGGRFSGMTHGAHDFASLIFGGALLVLGLNCAGTPAAPPSNVTAVQLDAPPAPVASGTTAPRSTELRAWFQVRSMKCGKDQPEYGGCYVITLSLHGAVEEERVVAKDYWGQAGCTGGTSVTCGGASGTSHFALKCTAEGACEVEQSSSSDGYCPPPEDCTSHDRLDAFTVPANTKLVFAKP